MSSDQTIPVILSACRTPVGKYLGGLAPIPAPRLGALVIKEAVRRAGVDAALVDEVILGNVLQGGEGQAPARQAAIHAGLPGTIDRKSTRLNSSHSQISYAVFCLKKKKEGPPYGQPLARFVHSSDR